MIKEACSYLAHRLQSGQCFLDSEAEVKLVGDGVFGSIGLDVFLDLLIGVELR